MKAMQAPIVIKPMGRHVGAEVFGFRGVDNNDEQIEQLRRAFLEYSVLGASRGGFHTGTARQLFEELRRHDRASDGVARQVRARHSRSADCHGGGKNRVLRRRREMAFRPLMHGNTSEGQSSVCQDPAECRRRHHVRQRLRDLRVAFGGRGEFLETLHAEHIGANDKKSYLAKDDEPKAVHRW